MKCRRLLFENRLGWWHRLWCADCRANAQVDLRIQKGLNQFSAHLSQEAEVSLQKRSLPAAKVRVWGLHYAALCIAIGAIATWVLLHPSEKKTQLAVTGRGKEVLVRTHEPSQAVEKLHPVKIKRSIPQVAHNQLPTNEHPTPRRSVLETLDYLNQDQRLLAFRWQIQGQQRLTLSAILNRPLPSMKDDFVAPPEFLFASHGDRASLAQDVQEAEAEYKRQAAISDDRLDRRVRFASKNDSLAEVCASLREQTGVSIYAGRSVSEDNVSLFISGKPAKDVMRSLTRLFAYIWRRTGSAGQYSYTFEQEMKDQIAEDRLRNEDISDALAKVVDASKKKPQPSDQRPGLANSTVEETLRSLFGELSINEFQQLRSGREVVLSTEAGSLRPLESDKALQIMDNMGHFSDDGNGGFSWSPTSGKLASEFAGTSVSVSYKLSVLELGGILASGAVDVKVKLSANRMMTMPHRMSIAEVPGIGEGNPRNAEANADLARHPDLARLVKIEPSKWVLEPTPELPQIALSNNTMLSGALRWRGKGFLPPPAYSASGDVWEAIHKATGIDIVADSFSRLFPHQSLNGNLFEVLNRYADALNTRWRYQDKTIYARSTTYAWQRLNETPKRLIERWKGSSKRGGLSIHDLIAMGQLSDRQLDSLLGGKTIYHYHRVPEWAIVARPWADNNGYSWRGLLRTLGSVPPATLDMMINHPMSLERLPANVLSKLKEEFRLPDGVTTIALDYRPNAGFYWNPPAQDERYADALGAFAKSPEEMQGILSRQNPTPPRSEIDYTLGKLRLLFFGPDRKLMVEVSDQGQAIYSSR